MKEVETVTTEIAIKATRNVKAKVVDWEQIGEDEFLVVTKNQFRERMFIVKGPIAPLLDACS